MLDIWVVLQLLPSKSFIRVVLQTAIQEVKRKNGQSDRFRNLVLTDFNILLQILPVFACKRIETSQHLKVETSK